MEAKVFETFGDRMKLARERRHLTLDQVGIYCGLSGHAGVRNWEDGENFPELANLVAAAGLYEASIEWLIWGGDVSRDINERVRRIPAIFRMGLIDRLHREIDETVEAAKKLPKEMSAEVVKDADARLKGWSAANLKKKLRVKPRGGNQ